VTRIAGIWRLAPLIAGLFLGGCMSDVTVQPEGANLLWNRVVYPARQRVNCVAIDPEGRIFLGVSDYEESEFLSFTRDAIYISSDNGETWAKKPFGPFDITSLAIDSEGRVFAVGNYSIKRSPDHGESWETLDFHPGYSGDLFPLVDSSDNIYVWTSMKGIYFSGDHGDGWTQIGDSILAAGELTSLAVNSKGCLFAIAAGKLYRSCDRGGSWTELPNVPWERRFGQLAIDSSDRIFISNHSGFYRSTDDGETWTAPEPPDHYVDGISVDGRDRLYALCALSLYVSDDGGDSWALIMSLQNWLNYVASNAAGDIFAAGTWGLSRSTDGGANWEMLGFSNYEPVDIEVDRNGSSYIGLACGGVYRSIDSLESWERFNKGLPDVRVYCLASANESMLIAGTSNGMYISPKDRPAWSRAGLEEYDAQRLFAFPGDSVAAFTDRIFISTDGGDIWSDIGLYDYNVRALIRTDEGRLLAGANFGGIFRYTGQGKLWDQMNTGLGDLRVNALAVTGGGEILAGTDAGVFVSSNGGVFWRRFLKERIQVLTVLVAGEDIILGTAEGILRARTDGSASGPQNEGLPPSDFGFIRSIAADPADRLYLFMGSSFYRSSQSIKELSPSGL
jgi:photosystem II stability/assembly factor-like uncharacterized protein